MPELGHQSTDISQENRILGSNQSGMRKRNERLVLTILRQEGPLPKVEIARRTGLSAQTVSVIMRALERDGLLQKGDKLRGKVGQPSVPLELVPDGAFFFGLKVGRRSSELFLVDFVGAIKARRRITYMYPTPEGTLEFVLTSVASTLSEMQPDVRDRVAGFGIASPFFLWEWATVIGLDESAMAAWRHCDLAAEIGTHFDFPVYLGNDATCACGAELVFGTAQKPDDFLYFYIAFFIGGGVVLNGSLYTGPSRNAGAIGPFPTATTSGETRELVDVASLIGLERRLSDANRDPHAIWETPEDWNVDADILEDWLAEATPAITQAILAAISIIDFSAIVVDGAMPSTVREKIVVRLEDAISNSNLSGLTKPDVIAGSVGADARALGAASIPLSRRFMLET